MAQKVEEKSIWDKIGTIDYRYVYITFIILLLIPILRPIGIPMKIGQVTIDYYNSIKNLPKGSIVLFENWVDLSVWADTGPIVVATFNCLWDIPQDKGIKIIMFQSSMDGTIKVPSLLKKECKPPQWRLDTYGTTWVDLGYVGGLTEAGLAALALDFKNMITVDSQGTPLMDIPIIKEVAARSEPKGVINAYDFDLYIWGSWTCTVPDTYVRQFWTAGSPAYKLPQLFMTIANCVPNAAPYYGSDKPFRGYIPGAAGAGELELLSGHPGEGVKMADLNDLGGVGSVIFLVLGNLAFFGKKFFEKKKE